MKPSFGFIALRREMSGPVGNVIVNTLVWLLMLAGAVSVAQAQTGALTVGLSTEPTILDPQQVGSVPDHNVTRNIFDSLLVRDENLKLAPGLAESWRAVNPTTYQFKLRRGVKFHNGEPFNASVVKFSIERQLTHPKARGKSSIVLVERVDVVDGYTVNVVTKAPFPALFARNAYAGTGSVIMVPPRYIQEKGDEYFGLNPVGTGAFKFVKGTRGDQLTRRSIATIGEAARRLSG